MYLRQDMLCLCLLDLSNIRVHLVQHMESLSGIRRLVSENDNFVLITSMFIPLALFQTMNYSWKDTVLWSFSFGWCTLFQTSYYLSHSHHKDSFEDLSSSASCISNCSSMDSECFSNLINNHDQYIEVKVLMLYQTQIDIWKLTSYNKFFFFYYIFQSFFLSLS